MAIYDEDSQVAVTVPAELVIVSRRREKTSFRARSLYSYSLHHRRVD